MDPVRNPFVPGAGTVPQEFAGRLAILEQAEILMTRAEQGRHAKSFMLVGLRGVGKTVLLVRIGAMARERGFQPVLVETPEDKSLPQLIVPPLRQVLLALDRRSALGQHVKRGLRVLRNFANSVKIKYGDVELGVDVEPERGTADSGDLEQDLPDLLQVVGEAAKSHKTVICLLIDELQYVAAKELSALIMGMHRIDQQRLPLVMIGAGLPQLVSTMGKSKSYAERLFDFHEIGPLSQQDAARAIRQPIEDEGEKIQDAALSAIIAQTQGYPYFLQVWGYQTWNAAPASPIRRKDVEQASATAIASLDSGFFRVRFDRLTPTERRYLRAMAELGPGPYRSGAIADVLGVRVTGVAPVRNNLIRKGMIYSPGHGDTAFTVPMFDAFMKRQMPELPSP
jgi:hypothetical protein